jgi:hypothetical protein
MVKKENSFITDVPTNAPEISIIKMLKYLKKKKNMKILLWLCTH